MTYTPFADSAPINDNTGPELVDLTEKNLQALRDALNMCHLKDWNYDAFLGTGGTPDRPNVMRWDQVYSGSLETERVMIRFTYGNSGGGDGHPATLIYGWKPDIGIPASDYGTETMAWNANGNLTTTVWSGTPALPDFEDGKPINSDHALQTVDYIRENFMALRDCAVFGAMNGWNYTAATGSGSDEEPQYLWWEKGAGPERLLATLTWTNGRVDIELWKYRPTSASGYTTIGTKTYTYDADSNVISAIWSGTQTYVGFDDDRPVDSDTGNTVLTDIKNNLQGLRDGILYGGMDFWDYSKTNGIGTSEMPQHYYLKKGTNWIRATNTWGTSGGEEHNIASQIWEYSSNSGGVYDSIGTLSFTYTADGAPSATTWS